MKKKFSKVFMAALASMAILAGCGGSAEPAVEETAKDQAILVVSFGTSYNDSRDITIGAVEEAMEAAFPDYDVRRAFTSDIIMDILEERDGLEIDTVEEALDRAVADGVKTLVVQPTHLMNGFEYADVAATLTEYADSFEQLVLAEPLLTSDADFDAVAEAIVADTASYADGNTAVCFMGHGTEAESNHVYAKLQDVLKAKGYQDLYIGTVEAEPTLEDVLAAVESGEYSKVVLQPLMVVAGDHANNDMAGDEEGTWKDAFTKAGYEVECMIRGLGELEAIQSVYVAHTQAAIDSLK